ncbi:hypothetical protein ScPMuIL_007864 [Solemya velum]
MPGCGSSSQTEKMAINTGITILIISIIVCILISDGIDGRRSGGGVRVGSRSRTVRTSRTSRVGSSAWKVALVAGAVYGSTHYMRRRRYRDHPNNEFKICTSGQGSSTCHNQGELKVILHR